MCQFSVSSAPLALFEGSPYHDLHATFIAMNRLFESGDLDGFELHLLAEWDVRQEPIVMVTAAAWQNCNKDQRGQVNEAN